MPTPAKVSGAAFAGLPRSSPASSTVTPSPTTARTPSAPESASTPGATSTRHERSTDKPSCVRGTRSTGLTPCSWPPRSTPAQSAVRRKRDPARKAFARPVRGAIPDRTKDLEVKKLFNWLIVLAACVGAFYGVGLIVPRNQTLVAKTNFTTRPADVFALLSDFSTWPQWHPKIATVQERPEKNDHPVWNVLTKDGRTFEVEVLGAEDEKFWNGTYTIEGTRSTLRFDISWFGTGSRVRVTRTADTRDPWLRAKGFFQPE